jgi:hypothetical protein
VTQTDDGQSILKLATLDGHRQDSPASQMKKPRWANSGAEVSAPERGRVGWRALISYPFAGARDVLNRTTAVEPL